MSQIRVCTVQWLGCSFTCPPSPLFHGPFLRPSFTWPLSPPETAGMSRALLRPPVVGSKSSKYVEETHRQQKKQNKLRCLLFYLNNRRKIIFDYILRLKFINHENQKKALTLYLLKAEDPIFSSIIFQSGNHLASFASFLRQVGAGIGLVWSGEHLQRRRRGRRRRSRGRRRRRVGWWERCTSPIVRSASSLLAHQSPSWAKPATINQSFSAYILNHHSTQCLTNVWLPLNPMFQVSISLKQSSRHSHFESWNIWF